MSNKEFYETVQKMIDERLLIYAEKHLPSELYVRIKIGGHFMAANVKNCDILNEIKTKIDDNQFFTEPQLNRLTGKSCTYSDYEVTRGNYMRIKAGKFKLYVKKDW